jgi:uncharacterized membrane protein YgdD (TMEM256/DUF423 family)
MRHVLFGLGAFAGLTSVAMASAAAHALNGLPADHLAMIRIALQIHGWHALALLACALWLPNGGRWTAAAGVCFALGLLVFCGAVYGQGLGWWHVPGAAPVGGSTLMLGWALLLIGCLAGPVDRH